MQQFKIHFSYNESWGGVSLLKQVIKADNIEDAKIYLMKKFDSFFMIDFENIDIVADSNYDIFIFIYNNIKRLIYQFCFW